MGCGVGRRRGSDPALLWLWSRLAAIVPIGPLEWEPLYAAGATLKRQKDKKKKKNPQKNQLDLITLTSFYTAKEIIIIIIIIKDNLWNGRK